MRSVRLMLPMAAVVAVAMVCFAPLSRAADKKVDVTGTWKSTFTTQNGDERVTTYKFKQDGEKLTGTVSSPPRGGGEPVSTEIKDGKVTGDEISFKVTRKFGDNEFTLAYSGKVEGDTIKAKSEFTTQDGQSRTRELEIKRAKDDKKDKNEAK